MLKLIKTLFLLAVLAGGALVAGVYWFSQQPLRLNADVVEFRIEPGSGFRGAIRQMRAGGIHLPELPFIAMARVQGKDGMVKAGSYELARGATPTDLLGKITRGEFAKSQVRLLEGWTFQQMRQVLDAHPHLAHVTLGLSDAEIMRRLGAPGVMPEGRFFPDTYQFAKGDSDLEVLKQAYAAMDAHLQQAWATRAADLPFTSPDQALILASIVEKETGSRADRDLIAAVFINRLRIGMRLQTDPTVIYGLGQAFDGNLRKIDLINDTPYNTYTRDGLPPSPIAMPSLDSIRAVMHPAQSEALYFVARGDGSSHFSGSLNEHNDAVNRYQRRGRTPSANQGK